MERCFGIDEFARKTRKGKIPLVWGELEGCGVNKWGKYSVGSF
jgi:hypothetical protein